MSSFFDFIRKRFANRFLSRWTVLFIDSLLVLITFLLAQLIRYDFQPAEISFSLFVFKASYTLGVYLIFFFLSQSFVGVVRHSGSQDFLRLAKATVGATGLLFLGGVYHRLWGNNNIDFSLIALIIQASFFLILSVGGRLVVRGLFLELLLNSATNKTGVLIFGAGSMGRSTQLALDQEKKTQPHVVAYIDDNPSKVGKSLNGIPIVSSDKALHLDYINKHNVSRLVLAAKNIPAARIKKLTEAGLSLSIEVKRVPPIGSWVNGELTAKQIRSVSLEELLGREPIYLPYKSLNGFLKGKRILVTGAAGSIGAELVRQTLRQSPEKVIALDQGETPLYLLDQELHAFAEYSLFVPVVASVCDPARMKEVFDLYKPDVILHAAAYKHVPLMEDNPREALKTNALGTDVVAHLAYTNRCDAFVMVSTDKAVNPTNIMGASKRIAEHVVGYYNRLPNNATRFVITRFGNVLGSNGSVIPLFKKQIEQGGPLTITHKDITRYFMTISEAVRLVLEAGYMGQGGELFVFDMGEPVKIYDLAVNMIKLSGLTPGKDITIQTVGLRPGEKLYEELLADSENTKKTHHPKIFVAEAQVHELAFFTTHFSALREVEIARKPLMAAVRALVPEYL